MRSDRSWLEISEGRLRSNFRALLEHARADSRSTSLLAVVKAEAYGHGAELCSRVLASAGARWLGVSDVDEGALVRRSLDAISERREEQPRILVMCGSLPRDAAEIVQNGLTPVVWSADQIDALADGASVDDALPVHLEIDTGMCRQGVAPGEALRAILDCLAAAAGLRLEGVLTHFASAEVAGSPQTARQRESFEAAVAQIAARGFHPEWIHAGNSSMIDEASSLPWLAEIARRNGSRSMVRAGLALYGYSLPLEGGQSRLRPELRPVLTWKSRIVDVRDLPAGSEIGYNATFTTRRSMRIALLPLGYADGLRRELSGADQRPGGAVLIHGRRARIMGRISMNLTTVDVSEIAGAAVGDEVTVLGGGSTAEDHAELAHTIPYEILCGMRAERRLTA